MTSLARSGALGALLCGALGAAAACAHDPTGPTPGTERGACIEGRAATACGAGLVCLSDRCVRPPGADCAAVASALTSLELGNYAAPEARRPKEQAWSAKCEAEHVTLDEGACVIGARTIDELRRCPRPVMFPPYVATSPGQPIAGLPADCNTYLATLERYVTCQALPAESRRAIGQTVAQMRQSWSIFSTPSAMPPEVIEACRQGNAAVVQAMATFHCGP